MRKIEPIVAEVLRQSEIKGNLVVLPPSLDRETYLKSNKVLTLFGAKWDRKKGGHVLADPTHLSELKKAMEEGVVGRKNTPQQEWGFFETPEKIASLLVQSIPAVFASRILEPSAGLGRLVRAVRTRFPEATVTCVEKNQRNVGQLRATFANHDDVDVMEADFLELSPHDIGLFDAILMNPPFANQADIDHVTHALSFLQEGGSLAAIMSAGVTSNSSRKAERFRRLVQERKGQWQMLPEKAFTESGTNVNTVMVVIPA